MNLLKQNPGVLPIMARDGWPKNEKLFDTADCIVMYMDGGGGHPAIKPERMAADPEATRPRGRLGEHALRRRVPGEGATATSPAR